ncbi:ABC transporter substrate-binding protein [Aliinostoc sp. HNIBRCY26]|uniref:ABC transporter substrate-binding protein n=1 Tax=Aliinostoc sp. HNIBRCY26 TaxID=3418997 RepID=UPI003D090B03
MLSSSSRPQPPENVSVIVEISDGSFVDGFSVRLKILEDGRTIQDDDDLPDIPAAPEIPQLYENWKDISLENSRKLQAVPAQVTNVATLENWRTRAEELENLCRSWFKNHAFNSLRDRIRANTRVSHDQSVPIIIKCETGNNEQDDVLRRIPWHRWDLFTKLPNAEFALFTDFRRPVPTLTAPVRVLAIFGSSQGGLQLEEDAAALQLLEQRGAQIERVSEPDEETLSHLLLYQQWQILFFAGHSSSEGSSGQIQISEGINLPLHTLENRLTSAVTNGLKLAIFNSCDGLGIADFFAKLNIPAVIVMREPVPDEIAYNFLLYFLREFSQGTPLCLAVRKARNLLEILQRKFPAASWLPTVCLNPNQSEFVWPSVTEEPPPVPIAADIPPKNGLSLLVRWRSLSLRLQIMLGFIAVVGIFGATALWKTNQCQIFPSLCTKPDDITLTAAHVDQYISYGQKAIADSRVQLSEPYLSLKNQGIAAFAQGKYDVAITIFDNLRNQAKLNKSAPGFSKAALEALQDPEILIYRNNAMVNLRHNQNPSLPIYTIAVAAPLNDNFGLDILFGVAQAQDVAVNRKDFNLKVVIANDNNNLNQAQEVAKVLANDKNILAVVGHYTSPNTCAALNIYSPENLVVISPTSTVVNFQSIPNCNDPNKVFYRTVSSSRVEADSLVRYLVEDLKKNAPKVVVFYNSQEGFSKDLFDQFEQVIRAFNGSIINKFDLSDPAFDTSKLPPEVTNADALVLLPDGGTNNSMALQKAIEIVKLNKGRKPILAANPMYRQDVINKAQDDTINSLFLAVDWHPQQCGAEQFRKEINEYWGGDLNRRTALAYEAVQAVVQAMQLSKPNVTRKEIRQKLSETGIRFETAASSDVLTGLKIRFDPRGDRKEFTTRVIVTVKRVKGRLSYELVKAPSCPPQ